jgi:hypothetical protein
MKKKSAIFSKMSTEACREHDRDKFVVNTPEGEIRFSKKFTLNRLEKKFPGQVRVVKTPK